MGLHGGKAVLQEENADPTIGRKKIHSNAVQAVLRKICICLFLISNHVTAQTGERWTLKSSSDSINIFTREIEGSKIKALKVECELEASLSQLVAVLLDVKGSEKWLYHTSSSYIVKQVSPSEFYYYSKVELPWPLSNRDFIAHLKVLQNASTKVVTIDAPCVQDMVPVDPKTVRVSNSRGKWIISPAGANKIKVVYTLYTDPGGNIPAWLINLFVTQGPSQSFKKLKTHLQKPVYKNARFNFIIN